MARTAEARAEAPGLREPLPCPPLTSVGTPRGIAMCEVGSRPGYLDERRRWPSSKLHLLITQ
eukprot:scaffold88586_cov39-Phaeocystis_antarctica.AAC.2